MLTTLQQQQTSQPQQKQANTKPTKQTSQFFNQTPKQQQHTKTGTQTKQTNEHMGGTTEKRTYLVYKNNATPTSHLKKQEAISTNMNTISEIRKQSNPTRTAHQ